MVCHGTGDRALERAEIDGRAAIFLQGTPETTLGIGVGSLDGHIDVRATGKATRLQHGAEEVYGADGRVARRPAPDGLAQRNEPLLAQGLALRPALLLAARVVFASGKRGSFYYQGSFRSAIEGLGVLAQYSSDGGAFGRGFSFEHRVSLDDYTGRAFHVSYLTSSTRSMSPMPPTQSVACVGRTVQFEADSTIVAFQERRALASSLARRARSATASVSGRSMGSVGVGS